jgi:SH3 domain
VHKSVHAANVPGDSAQLTGKSSARVARVLTPMSAFPRENGSMATLRATAAHTIPQRLPIQVVPGQQVHVGQHDTDWPAFVFVTTDNGAGWVPERYLDTSSDPAVVVTAYDTTELATAAGEELTLLERDDPSGWALVRNAEDRKGWVPLSTVEPVPEE